MNSSFVNVPKNLFSRHFGGTSAGTADPYISGYQFINFVVLPSKLTEIVKSHNGEDTNIGSAQDIQNLLAASCLSVTVPGGTLNKAEFNGLGGMKWSVPTSMDYGNTLSIRFLEYSSLPILHVFHSWFRLIREYRIGATPLVGTEYTKQSYASTLLYWTTKPDGKTVEYYACYSGVFPTRDPQDNYGSDIATNDKLELEIEFSLDQVWHEPWVRTQCQETANLWAETGFTKHGHYPDGSSGPQNVNAV